MGLKRKASFSSSSSSSSPFPDHFQFQSISQPDSYPYLVTSLSGPSTSKPHPFPHPDTLPNYLHSRTRKRHRDNRPDEGTVHQNTLEKLYAAQQRSSSLAPAYSEATFSSQSIQHNHTTSRTNGNGKKQQSLDSFFKSTNPATISKHNSSPPSTLSHTTSTPPIDLNSILSDVEECEDCFAPLLPFGLLVHAATLSYATARTRTRTSTSTSHPHSGAAAAAGADAEMMDVDPPNSSAALTIGPLDYSGFLCAACDRLICDVCAVLRCERTCLECFHCGRSSVTRRNAAGAGPKSSASARSRAGAAHGGRGEGKQWVGGIGWI
jgi:hypothetical protein